MKIVRSTTEEMQRQRVIPSGCCLAQGRQARGRGDDEEHTRGEATLSLGSGTEAGDLFVALCVMCREGGNLEGGRLIHKMLIPYIIGGEAGVVGRSDSVGLAIAILQF